MPRSRSVLARTALVGPLALIALLTAGCGDGAKSSGSGEPAVDAPAHLLETSRIAYPIQAYQAAPEQTAVLDRAQKVLMDRCMRRFGFSYQQSPGSAPQEDWNARRYGLSKTEDAARYGYGSAPQTGAGADRSRPAYGPNERLVLFGEEHLDPKTLPKNQEAAEKAGGSGTEIGGQRIPIGGCQTESALKLYAPTAATVDIQFAQNVEQQAFSDSRKDSRVVKAVAAWAECMAGKGYRTTNPLEAAAQLGFTGDRATSPEAIAAAGTDITCKRQTNLVGIWSGVEIAYQKRLVEKNAQTLKLAQTQQAERMRLADSLLRP